MREAMEDIGTFWFQKKLDLIIETQRELDNVMEALDVALKHPLSKLSYLNEMIEGGCPQYFSALYEHSKKRPLNIPGSKALAEIAREFYLRDEKAVSKFLDDVSEASFNFSERRTNFVVQTAVVKELFLQLGRDRNARLELAIMKWFLHAGKMVERLRHEGMRRSDAAAKAGRTKRKGYIEEKVYYDLLQENCDKFRGKSRNAICTKIKKLATNQEKERAKEEGREPMRVLSVKAIRDLLEEELAERTA